LSKPPHSLIGYLAAFSRYELLCDGDACIIVGSEAKLKDYLAAISADLPKPYEIKKARFEDLLRVLRLGGAYAFDEEAYNRFYPQAQRAGLKVGPEDFSTPPPAGLARPAIHLVRVQLRR
jgi:hypothetical protein